MEPLLSILISPLCELFFLIHSEILANKRSNHLYSKIIKPMHELGWHHHDIKPDNITADADGKLTLIDFNLAAPSNECKPRTCPDQAFLRKWGIGVI